MYPLACHSLIYKFSPSVDDVNYVFYSAFIQDCAETFQVSLKTHLLKLDPEYCRVIIIPA